MKKLNMIAAILGFLGTALIGTATFEAGNFLNALPDLVILSCIALFCLANALEK